MLTWQDISAFCVYKQFFTQTYRTVYTYLLLGSEPSFGWVVWQSPKTPEYLASGILGRLIVTRTGLPLLDISESMDALHRISRTPQESALGQSDRRVQVALARAIADPDMRRIVAIRARFERQVAQLSSAFYRWNGILFAVVTLGFCIIWVLHR